MIVAREMLDVELTRDLDDVTDWLDRGVVVAGLRHLVEGYAGYFLADLFLTGTGKTGIDH